MNDTERFDNFIKEYKELCLKHRLYFDICDYDELGAFELDDDLESVYIFDIKDKIT